MDIMSMALALSLSGGGGASSWDDLKDKPFGENTVVYFEVTEGYTPIEQLVSADGVTFYKVLDENLTTEQIIGSAVYVRSGQNLHEIVATEDNLVVDSGVISAENAIFSVESSYEIMGVTLTQGTWVVYDPTFYVEKLSKTTFTKLDPKYLPYENGNEVAY